MKKNVLMSMIIFLAQGCVAPSVLPPEIEKEKSYASAKIDPLLADLLKVEIRPKQNDASMEKNAVGVVTFVTDGSTLMDNLIVRYHLSSTSMSTIEGQIVHPTLVPIHDGVLGSPIPGVEIGNSYGQYFQFSFSEGLKLQKEQKFLLLFDEAHMKGKETLVHLNIEVTSTELRNFNGVVWAHFGVNKSMDITYL